MKVNPAVWRIRNKKKRDSTKYTRSLQTTGIDFHPPPILFTPHLKSQSVDGEGKEKKKGDKEKEETKEIELLIDPKDEDSTTIKKKVLVLRNPDPESWIIWLREFEEVCESAPIKEANLKARTALQFLAGNAKEAWQKFYTEAIADYAADIQTNKGSTTLLEHTYNKVLNQTISQCTREFFHMEEATRRQLTYMRYYLSTEGYSIREFANRLKLLNSYLPYFPPKNSTAGKVSKLDEDELVEIIIRAKPRTMAIAMMKANIDAYKLSWEELINYLERLELTMELEKTTKNNENNNGNNPNKKGKKRKSTDEDVAEDTKPAASKKTDKWCSYCKNSTHNTQSCWFKDKDKQGDKSGNNYRTHSSDKSKYKGSKETSYVLSEEQMRVLFANLPSHQAANTTSRKKRRVRYEEESSSGSEVDSTSFFTKEMEQKDVRGKNRSRK